ncbi:hypothetical protein ACIPJQ_00145 [Streptomyces griseoviridis]
MPRNPAVHVRFSGRPRDVAYRATTTGFRGPVAAVSLGCPSALFKGVDIINTTQEAGR